MTRLRKRLIFDGVLTALLIFEMFYQLTGNVLHEVLGITFFAAIAAHLALSRRWIGATARAIGAGRKMKAANTARAILGIALAATMLVLLASSLAISNLLLATGLDIAGGAYSIWSDVHTVSSYVLCGLVTAHLAVHWVSVAGFLRIEYDPSRRKAINVGVTAVAALGVLALQAAGVTALADPSLVLDDESTATGSNEKSGQETEQSRPNGGRGERGGFPGQNGPGSAPEGSYGQGGSGSAPGGSSGRGSSGSAPGGSEDAESGSSNSGICTLCRKRCSLSSPRCNRPYQEGLI